jgi:geranylgeranyl diphosphate synthase type I
LGPEKNYINQPAIFDKYQKELRKELELALNRNNLSLYNMLKYHLGWVDEKGRPEKNFGGKALRSALCLFTCEAVGGNYRVALPAAASLELIHNFSLIHDDIEDGDIKRRHRPTVWYLWGMPHGINAGDAMYVLSVLAGLRLEETNVPSSKVIQVIRLLNESTLEMIEGQCLDIGFEDRLDISVDDYLEMIDKKTGALIGCSLEMGSFLGNGNQEMAKRFRRCGRNLGLAFQIQDDILGIWGDEEKTGKPRGNDIHRKKKSFPVVYALGKVERKEVERLLDIYKKQTFEEKDVAEVLNIFDRYEIQEQAQNMAWFYCDKALSELERIEISPEVRREFEEISTFLAKRDF